MAPVEPTARAHGVTAGLAAYVLWGLFPIYWKLLERVPAAELLAHRITWSAVLLAGGLALAGRFRDVIRAFADPRSLRAIVLSASLITGNFFVFIWGVNHGRVTEVSLGYYINPILNVLLGYLVLRERMTRLQGVAVALAVAGVVILAVARGATPWVSLALASAFALYGLVRKTAPVEAMAGLTAETLLVAPFMVAGLVFFTDPPFGALVSGDLHQTLLVAASGPVTALPLFLFAFSARRVDYGVIGMMQYVAPTLQLALAVLAYGEPFGAAHVATFVFIWSAMALYLREAARAPRRAAPTPAPAAPASSRSG